MNPRTRDSAIRVVDIVGVGGIFLLAGLWFIAQAEDARSAVFLVFLSVLVFAPPICACVIYLISRDVRGAGAWELVLGISRWVFLGLFIVVIATVFSGRQVRVWALLSSLAAIVPLVCLVALVLRIWRRRGLLGYSDALLVVVVAAAVFALSPFRIGQPHPIGLIDYAVSAPHFGVWFVAGVSWAATGIWLRRREGWALYRGRRLLLGLAIALVILVILGLYDDSHFADFAHYTPLVAPAMHSMRGGTPMVDTYSQYGLLTWLVHRAAFTMFDPTFGVSAVVIRLVNLIFFFVIFLTLFFVSRRRLSALWFLIPAFLVALTTHNVGVAGSWNMHALPMTLGGRWLLPATMALLLVVEPRLRCAHWGALVIIALASLSSLEILLFTLAPWGYWLVLDAVRSRSLNRLSLRGLQAGGAIAFAHAIFATSVYLATGKLVDYWPYFNLFYQLRPAEASVWSSPFVAEYLLWLPIGLAYFLLMALAFYRALRRDPADSIVERLFPVVIFALGPLAYFFGKTEEGTLNIASLSFAIVAIAVAEVVFVKPSRFGPAGSALAAAMAFAFAFTIADGFEHFMRPLDPSRGNSSILRRCFTQDGCQLSSIPANIYLALRTEPLDSRTRVGYLVGGHRGGREKLEETIAMLRRLVPNAPYVGMLTDFWPLRYSDSDMFVGGTVFMSTGQWYAWGISSPVLDGVSPVIAEQILKRVDATPSGLPVVISHQRDKWGPINQVILDRLMARCRLALIESGKYSSVYMTENCAN